MKKILCTLLFCFFPIHGFAKVQPSDIPVAELMQILVGSQETVAINNCSGHSEEVVIERVYSEWLSMMSKQFPGYINALNEVQSSNSNEYCLYFHTFDPKDNDPETNIRWAEALCFTLDLSKKLVSGSIKRQCY